MSSADEPISHETLHNNAIKHTADTPRTEAAGKNNDEQTTIVQHAYGSVGGHDTT